MYGDDWMLIQEKIKIRVHPQNIKHYKNLLYNCSIGDEIEIFIHDLPRKAKVKIFVQCDYCKNIFERSYGNHCMQIQKDIICKDSCVKCAGKKRAESNLLVYGVDNTTKLECTKSNMKRTLVERYGVEHQMKLQKTKDKIKETCLKKYGVSSPTKLQLTKDKIKKTNQLRYGFNSYTQTEEYRQRIKKTNLIKYGTENVFQNIKIRQKQKKTILERYGCENVFQNEDIKKKSRLTLIKKYGVEHIMKIDTVKNSVIKKQKDTLSKHGKVPTSKQQTYLQKLLGGILNYQVDKVNLDIAFPDEKIYIEYNGGGHDLHVKNGRLTYEQFKATELRRYQFLKKLQWKQIEINSPRDYLPDDEIIIQEIIKAKHSLLNDDANWHYTINIGNSVNDALYGKLRKV